MATDTRADILNAALNLFAGRGYDAVGVAEVCDVAGITKPTLYHHFGSKQGLLDALVDEQGSPLLAAQAEAAAYTRDLVFTLERVVRAEFDFAVRHRAFERMLLALAFAPPESEGYACVARLHARRHDTLEALFRAAAADHGNLKGRHRTYAATFLGMINTYIGLSINGHVELDDQLVHRAVKQFMHGIFA
jgi:AcrR family transcriptional regulator